MNNKALLNLKEKYKQIETPSELNYAIQAGIDKGRKELYERGRYIDTAMKICASFIIIIVLFTGGINASPTFAEALKRVPVLGKLVGVLQFTDGKSGGGRITDGTDINNISLVQENGYENIIINFSQSNELQSDVGAFKVKYEENPYTMTFEIGGARKISAKESFEKILESKYVKDVYTIITLDDSLIRFVIEFKEPVKYVVKEMKDPASIVICLKEDKEFVEKNMYSLRTNSYPNGEQLGSLEEKLSDVSPTRILKDAEGMYFIELQSFETKEAALAKLDEISRLNYAQVFIEERLGNEGAKSCPAKAESGVINQYTNPEKVNDKANTVEKPSLYQVSIKEGNEYYYGSIEILDKGLNLYNEDIKTEAKYYFQYEDITLTKLLGEASFKLKIETSNKTIIASGVFSDFFEVLNKYTQIKE